MDKLTQELPGVSVYIDDNFISGVSPEDHLSKVPKLFQRLKEKGIRCLLEQCVFAQPSVEYLGFNLSKEGISKGHKVDTVINMPAPKTGKDLKSFLGQLQFYSKFLENLSTVVGPLFRLTRKNISWQWEADKKVKELLCTDTVLPHFDQLLSVGISCDASNVGIGAVLFHRYRDRRECPIANV